MGCHANIDFFPLEHDCKYKQNVTCESLRNKRLYEPLFSLSSSSQAIPDLCN